MKLSNIIIGGILFLFPTFLARFIINLFPNKHIGKNSKIGFSFLACDNIQIGTNCKIGHLNIILCQDFHMDDNCKIKHLNCIKGYMQMKMKKSAWINSQNKIASPYKNERTWHLPHFSMGKNSAIIMHHIFDVTDDIEIGEDVLFAGVGTQVWTHAFIKGSKRNVRVDGKVVIGRNCYIGSSCIICSGVNVADSVVIGAGTTVSKTLIKHGLYVNQPIRYIEYDADLAIEHLGNAKNSNDDVFIKS